MDQVTFGQVFVSFLLGALVGALFSERVAPYRKYLWGILAVVVLVVTLKLPIPLPAMLLFFFVGAVLVYRLLKVPRTKNRSTAYGSAQWADLAHLQENKLIEPVEYLEVR